MFSPLTDAHLQILDCRSAEAPRTRCDCQSESVSSTANHRGRRHPESGEPVMMRAALPAKSGQDAGALAGQNVHDDGQSDTGLSKRRRRWLSSWHVWRNHP